MKKYVVNDCKGNYIENKPVMKISLGIIIGIKSKQKQTCTESVNDSTFDTA